MYKERFHYNSSNSNVSSVPNKEIIGMHLYIASTTKRCCIIIAEDPQKALKKLKQQLIAREELYEGEPLIEVDMYKPGCICMSYE